MLERAYGRLTHSVDETCKWLMCVMLVRLVEHYSCACTDGKARCMLMLSLTDHTAITADNLRRRGKSKHV